MDFGGGNINIKMTLVVLTIFALTLPLSMNLVSAATSPSAVDQNLTVMTDQSSGQDLKTNLSTNQQNSLDQTINQESIKNQTTKIRAAGSETTSVGGNQITSAQLNDAASSVKTFVDANHRLPNYVTVAGLQITLPQFLELLSEGLLYINSGQTSSITVQEVSNPTNPYESVKSGNIQKTEYVQIAEKINTFVDANGRLPNYVSSSLGKIRYESLIYLYSKIVDFYGTNGRLPTYVSITAWTGLSSEGTTITDSSLQKYLQPTANCQSTSSTIKTLSTSITAGLTSTYGKAQAIFNWVRDNLSYSYYNNTKKGALGALSARSANCCDHSHLVIALARAAGIPGRYIHVYGHVYSQLYVDGKWYNADAINNSNYFGQAKSTSNILGTYAELPF
ncbi:MAG: Pseudomurein-binding repeat protein [Methanobacterium sp. PtaU1.Bin242]|nr:MAG: Pseudomurein-binding repeat protein [Methanobacterium sp. PtaU1.Bin242]